MNLKKEIEQRVLNEANYLLQTKQTIREIADRFQVSKSTVHKDLSDRLEQIRGNVYEEVQKVLQLHSDEKHIRGGEKTKWKYKMSENHASDRKDSNHLR